MAQYLKKGSTTAAGVPGQPRPEVQETVAEILKSIEGSGEAAVREYSQKLDAWNPDTFRLSDSQVYEACERVDLEISRNIELAASQLRKFAEFQLKSMQPIEVEVSEGVTLGHRHVPVGSVGAYVPGGRYSFVAAPLMSILTAKVAGVSRVVTMSPPHNGSIIGDATLYAMREAGADEIYTLGGVQALGAMAYGALEGLEPVDMLVGPGNDFVAEAKRQLFGLVGIDMIAGPTEILVLADESARPRLVAIDLLSQAEHGPTSPAILVTTSQSLGERVIVEVEDLLQEWPTAETAGDAWRNFGVVVVAEDNDEAVALSDKFAPEHLELQVENSEWFEARLANYGSLFVGENTTVAFGDKVIGTNHTLPTMGAARYTGGLWVGKFLKTLTYQRLTPIASQHMAEAAAVISRAEGMMGHAIAAEARKDVGRYQPIYV